MTAIRPTDSALRDKIASDEYNATLNDINLQYTEMDKFIGNLESDIQSIAEFESSLLADKDKGYDVGTSLDTLSFQKDSLQIDLDFFKHMKTVYIHKLYGDLYKYCDSIIENALAVEEIPAGFTRAQVKDRKFRGVVQYPPKMVPNPNATNPDGTLIEGEPAEIVDPYATYDMNGIFTLISTIVVNLRELSDDIGSFTDKINVATERQTRGFSVGNLIMNLESQQSKLVLEFDSYIQRLSQFLEQNKNFSSRCLNRIQLISSEIVTAEEHANEQADAVNEDAPADAN
tara:strand:- start:269 stop:1129 length:861 start_codon:yes stop_codon:yes gene_type:complete